MGVPYSSLFVRVYILLVSLAFGLAVAVWVGGEQRFSGPSFAGARALVEWIPFLDPSWAWGGLFFAHGAWLVFSLGRVVAIHALRFGIVVYFFFVVTLISSVISQPLAALTGIVVYSAVAALHAFMADHLAHRGWERC